MCKIPEGFKFSFSSISAYKTCPMMFKLTYIDKVAREGGAFSDYGTFGHKLLEEYAKGQTPEYLLASAYEGGYDDAVTHDFPPFPKGLAQKYYEAGLEYFENFNGFGDNWEVISVEEWFEVNVGGYPIVGLADLVLQDKDTKEIMVVDHKSKSKKSMDKDVDLYMHQLYIYALYVKQKYGKYPAKMAFNGFKDGYWYEYEFDENKLHETEKWIVDTIRSIEDEKEWLVHPSSFFCRYICSVFYDCEAGDSFVAKKGDSKSG